MIVEALAVTVAVEALRVIVEALSVAVTVTKSET